jgi:hypothetical protein
MWMATRQPNQLNTPISTKSGFRPRKVATDRLANFMNTQTEMIIWLLSFISALWFGAVAFRARRGWFAWALGGWLSGLVSATLILGLAEAAFIPLSHEAYIWFRIKSTGAAIFFLVVLGGFCWWQCRPMPPRQTEPRK